VLEAVAQAEPARVQDLDSDVLQRLVERGDVVEASGFAWTRAGFERATAAVSNALTTYHAASPLRPGMPREELRSRLGLGQRPSEALVARLVQDGLIAERGSVIALASHTPALTAEQERAAEHYLATLRASPYSPPGDGAPDADVLAFLEADGRVVRTADGVVFAGEAYAEMVRRIEEHLRAQRTITLAQVRDMFGTSRKYAQALLEHLDTKQVTRRVGDERVLR